MKFIQKHWLPVLIIVAIGLAVILNTETKKDNSSENQIKTLTQNTSAQCYLYEKEIVIENSSESINNFNREYVEISITPNGLATGQHLILPYNEGNNTADFVGVAQEGFVNVVATANYDGETWQEQRLYQIDGDKLFVGYQEVFVPRYRNDDGIYLYEDINKLKFETDEFFLTQINCNEVDRTNF